MFTCEQISDIASSESKEFEKFINDIVGFKFPVNSAMGRAYALILKLMIENSEKLEAGEKFELTIPNVVQWQADYMVMEALRCGWILVITKSEIKTSASIMKDMGD